MLLQGLKNEIQKSGSNFLFSVQGSCIDMRFLLVEMEVELENLEKCLMLTKNTSKMKYKNKRQSRPKNIMARHSKLKNWKLENDLSNLFSKPEQYYRLPQIHSPPYIP